MMTRDQNRPKRNARGYPAILGLLGGVLGCLAVSAASPQLVINELMYNPYESWPASQPAPTPNPFEYLELYNAGTTTVDLASYRFDNGITYQFPGGTLGPGSYLVVCEDLLGFAATYPGVTNVVGPYSGSLDNGGERVTLSRFDGSDWVTEDTIAFLDDDSSDGTGRSLELVHPGFSRLRNQYFGDWIASVNTNGTPGIVNSRFQAAPLPVIGDVEQDVALPPAGSAVKITARVTGRDGDAMNSVVLEYRKVASPQGAYTNTPMIDAGLGGDDVGGDGTFTAYLPPIESGWSMANGELIEFRMKATDAIGASAYFPATNRAGVAVSSPLSYLVKFGTDAFEDCAFAGEYETFHILMSTTNKNTLETRPLYTDTTLDATVVTSGGRVFYNSGTRYRGGTSRGILPRNYRMDLPKGTDLDGYTRINLNHFNSLRQHIGMKVTDWSTGGYSFDSSLARIYLNGTRLNPTQGVFHRFETFGKKMMDRLYGDTPVNQYSADGDDRSGYLQYVGELPASYYGLYFLDASNPYSAWYEMITLSRNLNAPESQLPQTLTNSMNIRQWAKLFATQVALDNGEAGFLTPLGPSGDELRLAVDTTTGRFDIFPWDYDAIIGASAALWGFGTTPPPSASANVRKFLFNRPMLPYYVGDVHTIMTTIMTQERMSELFAQMGSKMNPYKVSDLNTINAQRNALLAKIFTNLTVTGLADASTVLMVPSTNVGQVASFVQDQNGTPGRWVLIGTLDASASPTVAVTLTRKATHPIQGSNTVADAILFSNAVAGVTMVDDSDGGFGVSGAWSTSPTGGFNNASYRFSAVNGNTATWTTTLPQTGNYQVYAWLFSVPGSSSEQIAQYDLSSTVSHVQLDGLTGRAPQNYTDRVTINGVDTSWNLRANGDQGLWTMTNVVSVPGDVATINVQALSPEGQVLKTLQFTAVGRRSPSVVQGTISNSTTWSGLSGIVLVTNDVTVNAGATLTVDPGTVLAFSPGRRLTVNGTLNIAGTPDAPVNILPEGGTNHWLIRGSGATALVAISNAVMQQGSVAVDTGATLRIFDSVLSDNPSTNGIVSASGAASAHLLRTVVRNFNRTRFVNTPTLIEESLFERMTFAAIDMDSMTSTATVCRTTLREPLGADGLRIANATSALFTNVWIDRMSGTGVVATASSVQVADSLLTRNGTAVMASGGSVAIRNVTIDGGNVGLNGVGSVTNVILRDATQALVGAPPVGYSNIELPAYAIPSGTGNMNRKAFFRDASENDYRLLPESPCIATGLGGVDMGAPHPWGAAPLPPTDFQIAGTDSNSVTLAWQHPGTDEHGFEVYRSADGGDTWTLAGLAPAGSAGFSDTGVAPNQAYSYRVRAYHTRGASTYSDALTAITAQQSATQDLIDYLRFTEINYNPSGSSDITEFIELKNISTNVTLNLTGCYFDNGRWAFTNGTTLAPQQFFVLVYNLAGFAAAYPGVTIGGKYLVDDRLDNAGETLYVRDASGTDVIRSDYDDDPTDWYPATDGDGFTLVSVDPNPTGDPNDPLYWRASSNPNGSPGANDPEPLFSGVVINEVLAHADAPLEDAIEVRNLGTNTVNITGWFLSDRANTLKIYQIPSTPALAPGAFKVFYEGTSFNAFPGATNQFAISEFGEDVYLSAAQGGNLTGYRSRAEIRKAVDNGVSFGRYTRSDGQVDFTALSARTFGVDTPGSLAHFRTGTGLPNAAPKVGPLVINEIMYNPALGGKEFIEIMNITGSPVSFATNGSPWLVDDGINFTFPTSDWLEPGELALLVSVTPQEFRQLFAIPPEVKVYGPFSGNLANNGEPIELCKPGDFDIGLGATPTVIVDRVRYNNQAPWPTAANNGGASLERINAHAYGNDPTNWVAGTVGGTPGRPNNTNGQPTVGFSVVRNSRVETNETLKIEIALTPAVTYPVTVDYAVAGGTATLNADYQFTPGTLTFWPYETSKSVGLTILNDNTPAGAGEPDETVEIALTNVTGQALLGGNRVHTHTIVDTDAVNLSAPVILPATTQNFQYRLDVSMTPSVPGSVIHYRLDGGIPSRDDPQYTGPFWLYHSAEIVARTFLGSYNIGAWTSVIHKAQALPRDYVQILPTNTVEYPTRQSSDDGAQYTRFGTMLPLNRPDIKLGENSVSAALFRFYPTRDGVPQGVTVTNAFVQFSAAESSGGSVTVTLHGEATNHASTLSGDAFNISSRLRTATSSAWSPADWTAGDRGAAQRTPNISALINEIVSRPGWVSSNALSIIALFTTQNGNYRLVKSFDAAPFEAALLRVEWAGAETNGVSQYYFGVITNGVGSVVGANRWVDAGQQAMATASTTSPHLFAGWTGDVGGADTNDPVLIVLMTTNRYVTANFVLAPPSPPQVLEVGPAANGQFTLHWDYIEPYLYNVYRSTNLILSHPGAPIASGLTTNTFTDATPPANAAYYTISAEGP